MNPHFVVNDLEYRIASESSLLGLSADSKEGRLNVRFPDMLFFKAQDIRIFNSLPSCLPSLAATTHLVLDSIFTGTIFYDQILRRVPALTHLTVRDPLSCIETQTVLSVDVNDVVSVLFGVSFSKEPSLLGNLSAPELSALRLCPNLTELDVTRCRPITKTRFQEICQELERRAQASWVPPHHVLTFKANMY
ncbi:hypothetical protein HGRIS_007183 [Hohenbuehelia grisea]|uniref:Uncharacterized protein n=1 Tax=Hohenbuehelia grisea TaxID=104357 RepID=A0ABR3JBN5_9AGAR